MYHLNQSICPLVLPLIVIPSLNAPPPPSLRQRNPESFMPSKRVHPFPCAVLLATLKHMKWEKLTVFPTSFPVSKLDDRASVLAFSSVSIRVERDPISPRSWKEIIYSNDISPMGSRLFTEEVLASWMGRSLKVGNSSEVVRISYSVAWPSRTATIPDVVASGEGECREEQQEVADPRILHTFSRVHPPPLVPPKAVVPHENAQPQIIRQARHLQLGFNVARDSLAIGARSALRRGERRQNYQRRCVQAPQPTPWDAQNLSKRG